jgi:hypothetical protein
MTVSTKAITFRSVQLLLSPPDCLSSVQPIICVSHVQTANSHNSYQTDAFKLRCSQQLGTQICINIKRVVCLSVCLSQVTASLTCPIQCL